MQTRTGGWPRTFRHHTLLILGAVIMAFPFFWMVLTSLKTFAETLKLPIVWWPQTLQWKNYVDVLQRFSFGRYYLNTIITTLCLLGGQIFMCSLAAYAFTRLRFPGRQAMFFVVLSIMMVPAQMMLIPRFLIANGLGWMNSFLGLIIPQLPSAYGVFFLGQFMKTLPSEMEDAGRIDGCSIPRLFWNIALPMCANGLIAFGIVVVIWSWNEMLWPLTVTSSESMRLLSVGLATLNAMPGYASKYNLLLAASVLITMPMLVMFIIGQKRFISGIVIGGIKG